MARAFHMGPFTWQLMRSVFGSNRIVHVDKEDRLLLRMPVYWMHMISSELVCNCSPKHALSVH